MPEASSSIGEIRVGKLQGRYSKGDGVAGVYVWGFYSDDSFIPLYVGKSRNVFERLLQHYCRFVGGEYALPDIARLKKLHASGDQSGKPGLAYQPVSFEARMERFPELSQDVEFVRRNFAFRYLRLNDEGERVDAERLLAKAAGSHRLITTVRGEPAGSMTAELKRLVAPTWSD